MTKTLTVLLLSALLFNACVERGALLAPKYTKQVSVVRKTFVSTRKKPVYIKKTETATPLNASVKEKNLPNQNDSFSLTRDTKNKISGFFVFVIALITLL